MSSVDYGLFVIASHYLHQLLNYGDRMTIGKQKESHYFQGFKAQKNTAFAISDQCHAQDCERIHIS